MDFVTLILAHRKGVDGFSIETLRLLKDPVFRGVLNFLVTGESLTFKIFFKGLKICESHVDISGL